MSSFPPRNIKATPTPPSLRRLRRDLASQRIRLLPYAVLAEISPLRSLTAIVFCSRAFYYGCFWARNNKWLLSQIQRLAVPAGVGDRAFYPGWRYQSGQKVPFCPSWWLHSDKKSNHFIPVGNTNPDKMVTLLSRLVVPIGIKGPST